MEGFLQPKITTEIFLINQINNVSTPDTLVIDIIGQIH